LVISRYACNYTTIYLLFTPAAFARKILELVEKDLDASIAWFWKAIIAGDKLDSALKDMAVVMKQRGYLAEAIDAIKSLRHRCPKQSQGSLDNILLDLYKAYACMKSHSISLN
jgi:hypothetical protein